MEQNTATRATYIEKSTDYYLKKFEKMDASGKSLSWNWCAFLFAEAWLLYRKQYAMFFMMLMLDIIAAPALSTMFLVLSGTLTSGGFISYSVYFLSFAVIHLITGLWGNAIYRKFIDKMVAEGANMRHAEKEMHLKKAGTNRNAVIIYLVVVVIAELALQVL